MAQPIAPAERELVDPPVTIESQAFWDATAAGRLIIKKCAACGRTHWYPRDPCPFCDNPITDWIASVGRGAIYSFSRIVRASVPYVLAYVVLDEGPTMLSNIVDCDPASIKIGKRVELTFKKSPAGFNVPMFKLSD